MRERKFFDSKGEAEGCAEWARRTVKKGGLESVYNDELEGFGWTVADAIRFALEHLRKRGSSVPVEEAIEKLVVTKQRSGRSKRYSNGLGNSLKYLAAAFPGRTVREITTAQLNDFLSNLTLGSGGESIGRNLEHISPGHLHTLELLRKAWMGGSGNGQRYGTRQG